MTNASRQLLDRVVAAYRGARTRSRLAGDLALWASVALAGAVLLFSADFVFHLPPTARAVSGKVFLACLGVWLAGVAFRAVRPKPASAMAVEIEARSTRPFRSALVTAVELSDSEDVARYGYSAELVDACALQAAELAARLEPGELVDRGASRRNARRLAWVAVLAALVAFLGRDALGYIAVRYLRPYKSGDTATGVQFQVTPGNARIASGSQLTIRVRVSGTDRFPRMLKGKSDEPVALRHDGDAYTTTLLGLTEAFDYSFEAGPFRSGAFHVSVISPPDVASLAIRYHYPAHTGLPDELQDQGSRDLVAPVGTRVTMSGSATSSLTAATIIFDAHNRVSMKLTRPTSFEHSFDLAKSGSYGLELVGPEGFPNRPATYHITAVEDRIPLVYVLEPGKDLAMGVSEMTTIPLKVFATDDYGVRSLALHYSLAQRFEYTVLSSDYTDTIALPKGDARKVTLAHDWDLTVRVFQPGDVVTYYVEATDGLPGPKPHAGRSKTYTIRIPFLTDVARETAVESDEQLASVEDLAQKQKEIDERMAGAMKEVRDQEGQVDWKTRQELDTLQKKQQELKKRAEEVASRMQATADKMQHNDLVDAGTLEKLKEVQDLFNQVADSRMKELMEQMRQLMSQSKIEQTDLSKLQKDFDKSRYARELDRVLASLKKLRVQQELQRAVKSVEELAKEQEELRRQTEERAREGKPTDALAERQKQVQEKTGKLMEDLQKLAKDAEKSSPDTSKAVQAALDKARSEQLPQDVARASQQLQKQDAQGALQSQSQAIGKMRSMQDSLSATQSEMKKKQVSINLAKLLALTHHGLQVSDLQETLIATAATDDSGDLRELSRALAERQSRVHRGLESFERDFNDLIADEVLFKSAFVSAVSEMMDSAREATDAFEATHVHSGRQLAGYNLEKLNRVVAKLIEMVQQLMNQQQSAGMEGFFDQLEKLIEQQQKINEQAERLRQEPSSNPLLQQMMQQMAAQQAVVRQAMERLAEKYKQAREVVGDLEGVAQEMKEVEEALKRFDNADQTRQKQKKILYRMLEAEKSIHKQGESKKREAKVARDYAPAQADPVEQELMEVRQKLFNNLSRESYPVEHRDLVERYLRSIAQ